MRKNQRADTRKPEILDNGHQVLIEEGFEGASIGKMAKRMNIHPPPIIHCFKTEENMTLESVDPLNFSALNNKANMRVEILIDR